MGSEAGYARKGVERWEKNRSNIELIGRYQEIGSCFDLVSSKRGYAQGAGRIIRVCDFGKCLSETPERLKRLRSLWEEFLAAIPVNGSDGDKQSFMLGYETRKQLIDEARHAFKNSFEGAVICCEEVASLGFLKISPALDRRDDPNPIANENRQLKAFVSALAGKIGSLQQRGVVALSPLAQVAFGKLRELAPKSAAEYKPSEVWQALVTFSQALETQA